MGEIPESVSGSARGRCHPEDSRSDALGLLSVCDCPGAEILLRRALAVEAQHVGMEGEHLRPKRFSTNAAEVDCRVCSGLTLDEVSEPDAEIGEKLGFARSELSGRQTQVEERAPELVAGAGIVVLELSAFQRRCRR